MSLQTATTRMMPRVHARDLPMNAASAPSVAAVAGSRECVVEPKMDGWRLLAEVREGGDVRLYSRSGNLYKGALPHIEAELAANFPAGTWLDGEAVALRIIDGRVDVEWGVVQSVMTTTRRVHPARDRVTYMAFDLIAHGGIDARPLPLRSRRALLERTFEGKSFRHLQLMPQLPATDEAHDALLLQGFEGSMVKALDAPYLSGTRGSGWWKIKPELSFEAEVVGFKPGEGGFAGLIGAVEVAFYDDAGERRTTRVSGMTLRERYYMTEHADQLVADHPIIEVAYTELMPSGAPRHPRFKRWRPDRDADSLRD